MIGNIVGILADRERHSRVLHSSNFPSEAGQEDPWEAVCDEVQNKGFTVKSAGNYIEFRRGRSWGSFANNEGGAAMAREFLGGA